MEGTVWSYCQKAISSPEVFWIKSNTHINDLLLMSNLNETYIKKTPAVLLMNI